MEQHSKITQRHPSTGAQPSEQTAENAKKGQQSNHVWRIDEMLYKLVENNVAYAGEQFGENLRFNSEVLTNVLYDNIRKLVGDKFEGDEFANWLADELLKNGYILKTTTPSSDEQQPEQKVEEEIVYTIDEKDYQELLDKINATLVLLQTQKPTITKMFSDVDGQVKELGNPIDTQSELRSRRDKEIQELVDRIKSNQENIHTYIESHEQVKKEFAEKVLGLNKKVDEFSEQQEQRNIKDGKLVIKTKDLLEKVDKSWKGHKEQNEKLKEQLQELGKEEPPTSKKQKSPDVPQDKIEKVESPKSKQGEEPTAPTTQTISTPKAKQPEEQVSQPKTKQESEVKENIKPKSPPIREQISTPIPKPKLSSIKPKTQNLGSLVGQIPKLNANINPPNNPTNPKKASQRKESAFQGKQTQQTPKTSPKPQGKLGKSILSGKGKKSGKDIFGSSKKPKKPSFGQRIKKKLGDKTGKLKKKISNSFIGKTYRAVTKVVKFAAIAVVLAAIAVKKTIVAAWKTVKFIAKTFYKAAKFTGKVVKAVGKGAIKLGKKFVKFVKKVGVKGVLIAALAINPSKMVVKFGWKAVKFVGKSIWKGIKKLAFKAISFFGKLFGLMGKFVNKIAYWIGILGHRIADKAYRFIVKPLASLMVTIFNFVTGIVLSPIHFIKWLIPAVIDKILGVLSNISQAVKSVLKSTWSIFKRILCNPITIALIVGGLFFFLWKWLGPKLSGGLQSIKDTIVPMVKGFVNGALSFLSGLWSVIKWVGTTLFTWIEKITNPDGFLAKAMIWLVKSVMAIKRGIKDLMKKTGKNSIDILCMFLAGDMIGIILTAIAGLMVKLWQWLKKTKVISFVMGIVKSILAIGKLIFSLGTLVLRTIMGAVWQLVKGNFGGVVDAITKPWKDIWQQIKDVFSFKAFREEMANETLIENPVEKNAEQAKNTNISVRNLKMKGNGKAEDNLAYFNRLQKVLGQAQYGDLLPRIQKMNDLYQQNSQQVESYDEFLTKTWDIGQAGDDVAQQLLRQMLESPEVSQKLLSVFFYYNPQTGQTQMLRPTAYIGQFLDNIRQMMSDPNRDDSKAFKTLIEAFDQLNKERSHIVNNQGEVIADFADKIAKFDQNNKDVTTNGFGEISEYIKTFNKGDLFSKATAKSSFDQISKGSAKTKEIESVTGSELGTNSLLEGKPLATTNDGAVAVKDSDFVMPEKAKEPPSRDTIGNVVLPPGSNPAPEVDTIDDKSIGDLWREHQAKRNNYLNQGHTDAQAHAVGLDDMTLDQFKQQYKKMHPKSPEQLEKEEANRNKRLAALRNAKMISAFHNQGKVANKEGFKFTGTPSIIQIETDGLSQTLYMFSPEWRKYYNAVELNEDELMLAINKDDKAAQERIRKRQEAEAKKKAEEEAQRKREQQILDYSAKVEGGFIEVKVGEDVEAMRQAYALHMKKRMEFLNSGHTDEEAQKAGLIDYTWENWKRYYRKMHGLPEDGIKRIPFEGKRKEHQINWEARYPMSVDELAQYGIEVSEDGPVMIPLDKAMQAAGSLLQNAKTIYSVRDGLEIMRQGLKTETNRLKKQNKEGQPVAVAQTGGGDGGESTEPQPPDQSHYSEVG